MADEINNNAVEDNRLDWVEPEVHELSVTETGHQPGRGLDGETIWVDCTLS